MREMETHVEDLKSSNIEDTNEVLSLLLGVEGFITLPDQEFEASIKHCLCQGTHRIDTLILVTTLGDEFISDFDPWFGEVLVEIGGCNSKKSCDSFSFLRAIRFCLLFSWPLFELEFSKVHDRCRNLVDIVLFLSRETENVKCSLYFL